MYTLAQLALLATRKASCPLPSHLQYAEDVMRDAAARTIVRCFRKAACRTIVCKHGTRIPQVQGRAYGLARYECGCVEQWEYGEYIGDVVLCDDEVCVVCKYIVCVGKV